ncbi:MAG: glucokinase [Desulfovibrionaceae bacterium]
MERILAADIGGTNSRFAAFTVDRAGRLKMAEKTWLPSSEAESFAQLLQQLEDADFSLSPSEADVVVMALAGPVMHGTYCNPTNLPWDVDFSNSRERFGVRYGRLLNDFAAQAYACRTKAVAKAKTIQDNKIDPAAALGVIGAGTGLGHCALMPLAEGGFVAAPSEAGHTAFPFIGEREKEYERFVLDKTGQPYAIGDIVVAGRGLSMVHEFLAGEDLAPQEVGARLADSPETVEWFARFYARACRHYALNILAMGGLYISGGVAAKNPSLVTHPAFMREFLESPTQEAVLRDIPVFLNSNEDSGLYGAALYGQNLLQGR